MPPWQQLLDGQASSDNKRRRLYDDVSQQITAIEGTAEKFRRQLQRLIEATEHDANGVDVLKMRCAKAIEYFTAQIATQIVAPLREHMGTLSRKKKKNMNRYVHHLRLLEDSCWRQIERLYGARFLDERLYSGEALHTRGKVETLGTAEQPEKDATHQDPLERHAAQRANSHPGGVQKPASY